MSQRRHYMALVGMIVIMMSGVTLLLFDKAHPQFRNPDDVVWMERIRRSALRSLIPFRERIEIVRGANPAVRVSDMHGMTEDKPAVILYEPGDPDLPLEIIMAARDDVMKTSGWHGGDKNNALRPPPHAKHLFELKDHLWEITLDYIDTLYLIYGRDVEVPSSRVAFLEDQLETNRRLLEEEIARMGFQPVE